MRVGIGTSTLRSLGRRVPMARVEALLAGADRLGVRLIDTSNAYGAGAAERAVARAARRLGARGGLSEPPTVITKVGFRVAALPGPLCALDQPLTKVLQRISSRQDFSDAALRRAVRRSLRNLQGLRVEAVCLHEPSAEVVRAGRGIASLVAARSGADWRIGVSLDGPAGLVAAADDARIELIELPVDLWTGLDPAMRIRLGANGRVIVLNRVRATGRPYEEVVPELKELERVPDALLLGTKDPVHLEELTSVVSGGDR